MTRSPASEGELQRRAGRGLPVAGASVALAVVFVAGFLLVSTTVVVRTRLLDPGLYSEALARSDAYDRVYTEVLADPELADVVDRLLGDLDLPERAPAPAQVRALATSALRLALPPSTLRQGTEAVVGATLAYIRDDTDRLGPDIDLQAVLDRVDEAAGVHVAALLGSAREQVASTIEEYRAAVEAFADQLAAGEVPAAIPVISAAAGAAGVEPEPAALVGVILDAFGDRISPAERAQIETAVGAGDERGGLIAAVDGVVSARAAEAVRSLRADLEDGRAFDVVGEIADRAGRKRATVIDSLDTVRSVARWFGPATAAAGVALMVAAGAGQVVLHRRTPRRAVLVLASTAVVAGIVLLGVWWVVTSTVAAPLAAATDTGPGTWDLPAGVRALLGDVTASIGDALAARIVRLALVPITTGVVLAVCVVATAGAPARVSLPSLRRRSERPAEAGTGAGAGAVVPALPAPRIRRPVLVAGGIAVAGLGAVAFVAGGAGASEHVRSCNGSVELCERRYDEVTYAATHNSMSSPDIVPVWPEHDGDIAAQLDYGIRALLIDTHHWTALVSPEQLERGEMALPPDVAEQVFPTLGDLVRARPGAFLCHNECALGAIPLVDALNEVRDFLERNPDDVVTLIIQDAIPPDETADAFAEAGLDRYLHVHEPGTDWATLDEMIDAGERLVVFAEEEGPPPAWYHPAYENVQETPFLFRSPEDFSCAENRGPADAPLFLMNHWISKITPDRATAAQVNQHDVLVDRARRCERERGLKPNYLAVDFFGLGDVLGATDTLNDLD
jgi:hypothetical protein